MLAVTAMPIEDSLTVLEQVKTELLERRIENPMSLRIMLAGNCLDEISQMDLIEKT
jgi:hypothetical protein